MGEQDETGGPLGHGEPPGEHGAVDRDPHVRLPDDGVAPGSAPDQAGDHLVVRRLRELPVELADGVEPLGGPDGDGLVGLAAEPDRPAGRRDRHREDDPGRAPGADHPAGRQGRGAGGEPVVDDENGPSFEGHGRPAAPVAAGALLQLGPFALLHGGQRTVVHPGLVEHPVVEHPHAVLTDRAHRDLGPVGHAQFPDEADVEGGVEGGGHLDGHRHAAAREAEDHDVLVLEVVEPGGELPPGVAAIAEEHGPTPFRLCGRPGGPGEDAVSVPCPFLPG